jgi:ADP-heptose:LPS heptosyltransferase
MPPGSNDRTSALEGVPWPQRRSSGTVERIVIYRLGSLGDTVVALPCFHKIAAAFPNAERLVLTNIPVSTKAAPLPSILGNSGLVHGYLTYPVGTRSLRALLDLARRLRSLRSTTLVYLATPRAGLAVARDYLFFRLCGFKRIIGAPFSRDQRDGWIDPQTGTSDYEARRLVLTMSALGPIDLDDPSGWDLHLTEGERAAGARSLEPFAGRPFIAINMGGKKIEAHWGNPNWHRLFDELAHTHGAYGLLAVGGAEDAPAVETVTAGWPGPVVNACGALAPRETAGALEPARLFVGHDSGPMHLAAACGVRCVAIFGSFNEPHVWHPYGKAHRVVHNMGGIAAIEVSEILAEIRDVLPSDPAGHGAPSAVVASPPRSLSQ